jgi:hypothetical protein
MSKMFKPIFLALVSAFLVGCGSGGGGSSDDGDEVPRKVRGYFPDFNGDANYTIETLIYYPTTNTVADKFLKNLEVNSFKRIVNTDTLSCDETIYDGVAIRGCKSNAYSSQKYAILERVQISYSVYSQIMDLSDGFFLPYFPKHEARFIAIELYKNFGTNHLSTSSFETYGNSLTIIPYNFDRVENKSCWQKIEGGLIYEWCYGHNIDDEMIARWTIVKNAHYDVLESLR